MTKKLFLFLISFLSTNLFGQTMDTTSIDIKGKWTVCLSSKLDLNFNCKKGWTYVLSDKGTFIEGQGKNQSHGTYTLVGSVFTHTKNKKKNVIYNPIIENITWLDKNRFYSSGQEGIGGPTVYSCWQRIK